MPATKSLPPAACGPARYHLRFQILPGPNVRRDARTLVKFCREHGVEEVVLFFSAECWNDGLLTAKDETRWFNAIREAKKIIDAAGIATSLNPWPTVLHGDYGRTLPAGRGLEPMTSPLGEVAQAQGSFADPAWRRYFWNQYRRFAKLGFRVMWVEDDFRYHNHGPLTWGGGFEDGFLQLFSAKIGRKVTREELVRKILSPGKPHPWRAKWMAIWREAQIDVAAGLSEAVAEGAARAAGAGSAGKKTKIGLMSSRLQRHGAEGRDWGRLFGGFSIEGEVAHRPGFGCGDKGPLSDIMMALDSQRPLRPAGCEVAPEVENSPFTRWAHSDTRSWAVFALCMLYGSDALLLDLFPFSGNPADRDPEIGELLSNSRPALDWIVRRFAGEVPTAGVGLPWRQDAGARVRTTKGESMSELEVMPYQAGQWLLPYGVPVTTGIQDVNAIFGPLAWAFDDEELRGMLSGGLLLDGAAAEILCRRGLGDLVGVEVAEIIDRWHAKYTIEVVARGAPGVPKGHYFNLNHVPQIGVLKPRRGAEEWTTIITPDYKRVGAGMVGFTNRLGGRVMVFAQVDPAASDRRRFQRQTLIQKAVRFCAGGRFGSPLITGGAHLVPIHFHRGDGETLVVFNDTPDAARPVAHIPGAAKREIRATLLRPLARPVRAKVEAVRKGSLTLARPLVDVPYLGCLVLDF